MSPEGVSLREEAKVNSSLTIVTSDSVTFFVQSRDQFLTTPPPPQKKKRKKKKKCIITDNEAKSEPFRQKVIIPCPKSIHNRFRIGTGGHGHCVQYPQILG